MRTREISAQAPTVHSMNAMWKRMKCAGLVLCVGMCSLPSLSIAQVAAKPTMVPISNLDLTHLSIEDTTWLANRGYRIHIPLMRPQLELEAVTWSFPTVTELAQALTLLKSRDVQAVSIQRAHVTYNDRLMVDECKEKGLDLMSNACLKIMREEKNEMFKVVECTKVCPISALNY